MIFPSTTTSRPAKVRQRWTKGDGHTDCYGNLIAKAALTKRSGFCFYLCELPAVILPTGRSSKNEDWNPSKSVGAANRFLP